jgi:hypothetical protein
MVGLTPLKGVILVRIQVPQQSSLVLNDQEGSEQTDIYTVIAYLLSAVFKTKNHRYKWQLSQG